MKKLFDEKLIRIVDGFENKGLCLDYMIGLLAGHGCLSFTDRFATAIKSRELVMSTGIGRAVAIPHARDLTVTRFSIAVCLLRTPLDFDSVDNQPVRIVFMMAVPEEDSRLYMRVLKSLAEYLRQDGQRQKILDASSERKLTEYVFEIEDHINSDV